MDAITEDDVGYLSIENLIGLVLARPTRELTALVQAVATEAARRIEEAKELHEAAGGGWRKGRGSKSEAGL